MSNVTEVSKILELDLSNIPREERAKAKKEVGDYLVNQILREVGNGNSPVKDEGRFKKLTKKYAKSEKGGSTLANLELDGDMLEALKSENKAGNKIWTGIKGSQAPKADGHNQISDEAKAWASRTDRTKYKRRFIPDEGQTYTPKIMKGIDEILSGYRVTPEGEEETTERVITTRQATRVTTEAETTETTSVSVNEFFTDDILEQLLLEELKKKGRINGG